MTTPIRSEDDPDEAIEADKFIPWDLAPFYCPDCGAESNARCRCPDDYDDDWDADEGDWDDDYDDDWDDDEDD